MKPTTDDLTSLLVELIKRESENPPGNEAACAEYVHDWLTARGIEADYVREPDQNRPQVGAKIGEGDPTLVLNAHMDVVPAGNPERWTYDPYGGITADGRVYGRGAADTKAGLAIAMALVSELRDEVISDTLSGSLVLHAAMGEETGEPGTKSLLEAGYTGDYGVVLEPTGFRVATKTKGVATYRITVHGEPSHASRPDQGLNPIEGTETLLGVLGDYDRRLRSNVDPLLGPAYGTVTELESGTGSNMAVIPNEASLLLDRRVLPGESIQVVDREVENTVTAIPDRYRVEWTRIQYYEPAAVPDHAELASVFREIGAEAAGLSTEPWGLEAATDMRNFVNDAGIESITWGPGELAQAHTVDEYVERDALETGFEILHRASRTIIE